MDETEIQMHAAEWINIGQTWRRKGRGAQPHYKVRQVHRPDHLACLVGDEGKLYVKFSELRRKWRQAT